MDLIHDPVVEVAQAVVNSEHAQDATTTYATRVGEGRLETSQLIPPRLQRARPQRAGCRRGSSGREQLRHSTARRRRAADAARRESRRATADTAAESTAPPASPVATTDARYS